MTNELSRTPANGLGRSLRAAAIQLEATLGDVAENLRRVERLVDEAAGKGARLIAVPEFFTTRIAFHPQVHAAVVPATRNQALSLLQRLAKKHQCFIGGSFLVAEGDHVRNRYHLVEPDGRVHVHDKDLPTMWENAFYGPADPGDDGAFSTALGGVGVAVCWELIRSQTVRRLVGRVDVVVTGTHWWTMPTNWGSLVRRTLAPLGQFNRYLSENAPIEFARRVGAPVLQASHCGQFRTHFLLAPGFSYSVPYDTEYVGATQIVSGDGHVVAHRQAQEGPGVVIADVNLGAQQPVVPLNDRFWIPELPAFLRAYWHQQNACGKAYYRKKGRLAGLSAAARVAEDIK